MSKEKLASDVMFKDYPDIVSALESKGIKVDSYKNLSQKEYREVSRKIRKGEI